MGMQGKVCVITGGGSGIGRGAALMMAGQGARIVAVGRTASKVEAVREEVASQGGEALAFGVDVADYEAVRGMVKEVLDTFGRVDVLVNNAGHSSRHRRTLTTPPDEIRSVIDSNLVGSIYCTQAVLPSMLEAKDGLIINVASLAGINTSYLGGMIYSAVKAGVIHFTKFLNFELTNTGVRASVLIPGEVDTPIMEKRPVRPTADDRTTMSGVDECAEALTLIAGLPKRSTIAELIIRPTTMRNPTEVADFP
ncbi:MAG: SDR family NAD(P)-dependent oxidoreductase [Candidatus Tectomicrobia bacterium]|nr:SDR family NAD(P)-dependent oxidoreductase [Candidatus Tectomicrobia bacterium]